MIKNNFTRTQVLELMEYLDNRKDDEIFDTYQEELDYYVAEKQVNDINYTHSSTQLNENETPTFEEWKELRYYTIKGIGFENKLTGRIESLQHIEREYKALKYSV